MGFLTLKLIELALVGFMGRSLWSDFRRKDDLRWYRITFGVILFLICLFCVAIGG